MPNVLAYAPEEKWMYGACTGLYGTAEKRDFDLSHAWKKLMRSQMFSVLEKLKV